MVCRVFLFGNGRACCSFTCFCGGRSNRVNGRREGLFTNMKLRTSKRLCYFRQLKKQKLLGRKIETETGLGMAMPRTWTQLPALKISFVFSAIILAQSQIALLCRRVVHILRLVSEDEAGDMFDLDTIDIRNGFLTEEARLEAERRYINTQVQKARSILGAWSCVCKHFPVHILWMCLFFHWFYFVLWHIIQSYLFLAAFRSSLASLPPATLLVHRFWTCVPSRTAHRSTWGGICQGDSIERPDHCQVGWARQRSIKWCQLNWRSIQRSARCCHCSIWALYEGWTCSCQSTTHWEVESKCHSVVYPQVPKEVSSHDDDFLLPKTRRVDLLTVHSETKNVMVLS